MILTILLIIAAFIAGFVLGYFTRKNSKVANEKADGLIQSIKNATK